MADSASPVQFTITQLEYFITTIEQGSFTGASQLLGVSQPAVAEQIQRLERVAGQSLFARRARGVTPTRSGLDLEPYARRVLDSARDAMSSMTDARTIGRASVAIGTFASAHHYEIAGLIEQYLTVYPLSRVRVEERNSSATADAVRAGELDAAVVVLPVDESGLDVRPIFEAEVMYVSADEDAVRRPVSVESLADRQLILYESSTGGADPTRFQLAARAQAAGMRLTPRIEVEFADTAVGLAAAGLGDTYIPRVLVRSLDPRLHATGFDPPLVDVFALVSRAGSRLSAPVRDLVDRLVDHLVAMADG